MPQRTARGRRRKGTPPYCIMHTLRTACRRGIGGVTQTQRWKGGTTPEQHALPAHGMQEREGGGGNQERERGSPPEQERTPLVCGLIQEMGGGPQDLQRLPTARHRGSEGGNR